MFLMHTDKSFVLLNFFLANSRIGTDHFVCDIASDNFSDKKNMHALKYMAIRMKTFKYNVKFCKALPFLVM